MYYINVYIIIYVYGSVDFLIVPCLLWFKRMCLLGCYWDCWPVSGLHFSVLVDHFLWNSCRLFWGFLSIQTDFHQAYCHVEPLCMLLKVTWHLDGTMYNSYIHHFLNIFSCPGGWEWRCLRLLHLFRGVAPNTLYILYCCSKYTLVPNALYTLYGVPNTHFKNVGTWEPLC